MRLRHGDHVVEIDGSRALYSVRFGQANFRWHAPDGGGDGGHRDGGQVRDRAVPREHDHGSLLVRAGESIEANFIQAKWLLGNICGKIGPVHPSRRLCKTFSGVRSRLMSIRADGFGGGGEPLDRLRRENHTTHQRRFLPWTWVWLVRPQL